MSVPAYVALAVITALVIIAYALNPNTKFLLTALPMLVVLAIIPPILTEMNRRMVAGIDTRGVKLYKIGELSQIGAGATVRIRGTVTKISLKWLNRPNFFVSDEAREAGIKVLMFSSPREQIQIGDRVEAIGTLRSSGKPKKKTKTIWGVQMKKLG